MKKILLIFCSAVILLSCVASQKEEEARKFIQEKIRLEKETVVGKQIDYLTRYDDCEFRNDNIYYYYTIDESYVTISQMKEIENSIREELKYNFNSISSFGLLKEKLKILNGNIYCIYRGNYSQDIFTITINL